METNEKLLLLIDGNSLITASYFALPPLYTSTGIPTNALKGFVDSVHKLFMEHKPSHMLVAFDSKTNKRKESYPSYKANRQPLDSALYEQYEYIEEFLHLMQIPIIREEGYEADDLIASFTLAFNDVMPIVIASRDKDLFRLCCFPETRVAYSVGSGQLVGSEEVVNMLGVLPEQVGYFKALSGDPSDNIKGVPGIGKVTAAKLLREHGDLNTIVKLASDDELPSKRIAKLIRDNMGSLNEAFHLIRFMTHKITLDINLLEIDVERRYSTEVLEFLESMEFNVR